MAEQPKAEPKPKVDMKDHVLTIYASIQDKETISRVKKLAEEYGLSATALFFAAIKCCIDSMEEQIPNKRVLTLNGKKVIL